MKAQPINVTLREQHSKWRFDYIVQGAERVPERDDYIALPHGAEFMVQRRRWMVDSDWVELQGILVGKR